MLEKKGKRERERGNGCAIEEYVEGNENNERYMLICYRQFLIARATSVRKRQPIRDPNVLNNERARQSGWPTKKFTQSIKMSCNGITDLIHGLNSQHEVDGWATGPHRRAVNAPKFPSWIKSGSTKKN